MSRSESDPALTVLDELQEVLHLGERHHVLDALDRLHVPVTVVLAACFADAYPPGFIDGNSSLIIVIAAGREFKKLGAYSIGELLMATPAISDGVMYVRGMSTLFAIGKK